MKRAEAFAAIADQAGRGELRFPTSVNAALRLQLALDDPDCHIERALSMVLAEPLLAARTVALANSTALRGGGDAVTNVRAAVMRVGYRNLQTMVAAMVVRRFGSKIADPVLRATAARLWEHTAHVAALARALAVRLTGVNPDTALFAAVVHEAGGFYLLSRAGEFPGLLDDDAGGWRHPGEDIVAHAVMRKLLIPETVAAAIMAMRDGALGMPPESLADTLVLADHLAPVASPLARAGAGGSHADSALDFVLDEAGLREILAEAAAGALAMSPALLA